MNKNNRKLLRSAENLLDAARYQSGLVKSDIREHNTGGYSATVAEVRFGILRTPKGYTKIFSPEAYFSLENKVRITVEEIIKNEQKTCREIHDELKRKLPKLPGNKDERQLIKMYEAASMASTHSMLSELILRKEATEEIVQTEDGLFTVYKMKA